MSTLLDDLVNELDAAIKKLEKLEARIAELEGKLAVRQHDVTPCQSIRISEQYAIEMTEQYQERITELEATQEKLCSRPPSK